VAVPTDRRYLESHEWHRLEGDVCTIGISQFAADELTDITYVDLPTPGDELTAGEPFGEIESVKATSDLTCGVSGVVAEVNDRLGEAPELVNSDPFDAGWMIKVKVADTSALDALMDAASYDAKCEARAE